VRRTDPLVFAIAFCVAAPALGNGPQTGGEGPRSTIPCALGLELRGEVAWRGLYGRGYEASSPSTSEPVSIGVRHAGAGCSYFVVVSGVEQGLSGPGASLAFDVLDEPSGRSISSSSVQGSSLTRLQGSFPEGDEFRPLSLFVTIPPGQNVRGGSYSGRATVSLYRDSSLSELVQQIPLPVSARVPPVLSVRSSIFLSQRSGSIDLGRLDQGADAEVDFSLTTNVATSVRIESANGGKLEHQSGTTSIPYRASMAGRPIDLSSGSDTNRLEVSLGTTVDLPLRILVAPSNGAAAGVYHDTITVTFTAD